MANTTVRKSLDNGFTREQHYAAASDIDSLFKKSVQVMSHADKYGDPNVKAIHRFAAPLFGDNVAYITVKESTEHGKRIYTVELMEIGKLEGVLDGARNASHSLPSSNFPENNKKGLGGMLEEAVETPLHTSRAPSPQSGGILEEAQAEAPTHFPSPRLYRDNINKLRAAVNSKNKKSFGPATVDNFIDLSDLDEAASPAPPSGRRALKQTELVRLVKAFRYRN